MFTRSRGRLEDSSEVRDSTLDENVFFAPQRIFHVFESAAKSFNAQIYHRINARQKRLPKDNMIEASVGPTVGLATVVLFVAAARKGVEPALNLATEKESQHSF